MIAWLLNRFRRHPAPLPQNSEPTVTVRLPCPAPEDAPEWNNDHRGALLQYLRSSSGQQLLLFLRFQEEILKTAACDAAERRVDHARGQAGGYRKAIASLIVLSAPPPPKEETATGPDSGADLLRDQLSH